MTPIERYKLQRGKQNKYDNKASSSQNNTIDNYISAIVKNREEKEQEQIKNELLQNIIETIENSFK